MTNGQFCSNPSCVQPETYDSGSLFKKHTQKKHNYKQKTTEVLPRDLEEARESEEHDAWTASALQ